MPYFDHNATTPLSPEALDAWSAAASSAWQNPSSLYRSAARVRNALEATRAEIADLIGCAPERLIFNSGATEGANALFQFFASRHPEKSILLSSVEHPCGIAAATRFFDGRIRFANADDQSRVILEKLQQDLESDPPALVSIMAANNETGVLQPWEKIAEICRAAGVPFHCDATQWIGKLPTENLGRCDFVTASAHKTGGPKGIGFMIVPEGSAFYGQTGGEQEFGKRGGTENFPSISALHAAWTAIQGSVNSIEQLEERLLWRRKFEKTLTHQIPGLKIAGQEVERLWNTVSLILPKGANARWVRKLDRRGFSVSTGSACSSGKEAPSHVLEAMGFSAEESQRSVRVSSGWSTSQEDWQNLETAFIEVFEEIREEPEGGSLTTVIQI